VWDTLRPTYQITYVFDVATGQLLGRYTDLNP